MLKLALLMLILVTLRLGAQGRAPDSNATSIRVTVPKETREFIRTTRAGTARYRDMSAAVADGYHRVGVTFPAMGEHWINLRLIMENRFDITRPPMLIYLPVGDSVRLAGVGYTALLDPGQPEPDFALARGYWHEHNGSITDESLPLNHHQLETVASADDMRLLVLHAWVWSENPAGVFVTDNWSLPLEAASLSAASEPSRAALRALAVAHDGTRYVMLLLRQKAALDDRDAIRAEPIVARTAADISKLLVTSRTKVLDAKLDNELAALWRKMWADLERALPVRATALRALRDG